jgi:hypothetical protein
LRFADRRVQALFSGLVVFRLLPSGFSARDLAQHLAPLLGQEPLPAGRLTYDLLRLRLHGLIERVPQTHRYRVTALGLRVALFFTRAYTCTCALAWPPWCPTPRITTARSDGLSTNWRGRWIAGAPKPNSRHET